MFKDFMQPQPARRQNTRPAQAEDEMPEMDYDRYQGHRETLRHLAELYEAAVGEERRRLREVFREQAIFKGDMTEAEFDQKYPAEEGEAPLDWRQVWLSTLSGYDPGTAALDRMHAIGEIEDPAGDAYSRIQNIGRLPDLARMHPLLMAAYLQRGGF